MIISPVAFLTSRNETVATRMSARRWRIPSCASGGKKPMRRLTVATALWVCRVERTRWPV
jgi:hypothetical protein